MHSSWLSPPAGSLVTSTFNYLVSIISGISIKRLYFNLCNLCLNWGEMGKQFCFILCNLCLNVADGINETIWHADFGLSKMHRYLLIMPLMCIKTAIKYIPNSSFLFLFFFLFFLFFLMFRPVFQFLILCILSKLLLDILNPFPCIRITVILLRG